jgi:hypothetical protein
MSEAHKSHHEHHEQSFDAKELQERQNELLRESQEKAEKAKNSHAENLKNIREQIEKEATSSKEKPAEGEQKSEPDATNTYWYSKEYRDLAFKQLMGKVRHHLTPTEKLTSKVMHQPLVERVSEVGAKTVARPSGVLVGSIFSFVASLVTYFFAKQNGYDMTYGIFAVSFVGGFLLGLVIEFSYKAIRNLLSRD